MGTRERPAHAAGRAARLAVGRLCDEIRRARRNAGLSQATVARAAGLSRSRLARLEAGQLTSPPIPILFGVAAVVGLDVSLRAYPGGDAIRDAAHARLLDRFRRRLHPSLLWRSEVPLPIPGDRRSWDGTVGGPGWSIAVEAETGVDDTQALDRRVTLKRRDGGADVVIIVLADTRRNRAALNGAPAAFADFPLRTREILAALGRGLRPRASGVVLL
jgi:transcriptional regulator with XRE-family HTH domain